MNVSIIAVGTELLFGQVVNTNAAFLSEKLNHMGFNVMYHHVVGDNPRRLEQTLRAALEETDIVLLTGGLGPTQDDLTKETVAKVFGSELYLDESCLAELKAIFETRHRKMAENNVKQAYIPSGATIFHNKSGTAPAFAIEKDGKYAICFPGPPREMKWVYEHCAKDYLEGLMHKRMYYKVIRTIGIGESDMEMVLMPLIDGQTDPTIATYAKEGECSLRVASQRATIEEAKAAVDEMIGKIDALIGKYIYSYDDEELKEVVVHLLTDKKLTLTSAESCTGGMFAAAITDVAGASEVYKRGAVVYSAEAKIDMLGVDPALVECVGVVDPEVARQMAEGAARTSGADIAVAVTGFAGPSADEGFEPGTAYIGFAYHDRSGVIRVMGGRPDRKWNRNNFVLWMLRTVYNLAVENEDFFARYEFVENRDGHA
ncbi:MAG: competence/damage-inducible protein A [Mogibacterium sp.]|nr:competence/damage-inducible protein A [Mogibacterium sp.]